MGREQKIKLVQRSGHYQTAMREGRTHFPRLGILLQQAGIERTQVGAPSGGFIAKLQRHWALEARGSCWTEDHTIPFLDTGEANQEIPFIRPPVTFSKKPVEKA